MTLRLCSEHYLSLMCLIMFGSSLHRVCKVLGRLTKRGKGLSEVQNLLLDGLLMPCVQYSDASAVLRHR